MKYKILAIAAMLFISACQTTYSESLQASAEVVSQDLSALSIPQDHELIRNREVFAEQLRNSSWANAARIQTGMSYYRGLSQCDDVIRLFAITNVGQPSASYSETLSRDQVLSGQNSDSVQRYAECMVRTAVELNANNFSYVDDLGEIILYHATERNIRIHGNPGNADFTMYQYYNTIGYEGYFYALFKDWLDYTPEEQKIVEDYFVEKFSNYRFQLQERRASCSTTNPVRNATDNGIDPNGCGTYAFQMVIGELAFSLATRNQTLFEKAGRDVTFLLSTWDDRGISVIQAARGGLALGYHKDMTIYLSTISELYYTVGYDFLEHRMPRSGITVKEVFDMHWEILYDHTILDEYARYNRGVNYSFEKNAGITTDQYIAQEGFRRSHVARYTARYIERYRPDLVHMLSDPSSLGTAFITTWVPLELLYKANR